MTRPAIYSRPAKPLFIAVKNRKEPAKFQPVALPSVVAVDRATECHVTPDDVARRMVAYLGECGDYLTLEPSAGTGQLVRALLASGHSRSEICMIERHNTLAAGLAKYGPVINRCFLDYAAEARGKVFFPRVIINPPFSDVRKHIAAALSLMGPNGHECPPVMVALVPITYQHPDAEELETLPNDTFSTARVNTKIIRIEARP